MGLVPRDKAVKVLLNDIDVSLILINEDIINDVADPNRLFESMAAGKAIVAPISRTIKNIVGNAAVFYTPGDEQSLRKAIEEYIKNPALICKNGRNLRKRYLSRFSWKKQQKVYDDLLHYALKGI